MLSNTVLQIPIRFDQPQWLKAFNIIQTEQPNKLTKIIVRLGAFHAEMSFLGSIGHLMAGSGLRELLELIYASNPVDHIMTGKLFPVQCVHTSLSTLH